LLAFPPPDVDLMRKSALEVIHTIRLTFAGTLLVVGFSDVAPLPGQAVELVDPHAVLEQTRRDLIQLDRRMERYRAERQKEEARQKREAAEQARSDKALEEVRRKREIAEQEKRVREEKER
jgi:ferredoxin-NADP reductase